MERATPKQARSTRPRTAPTALQHSLEGRSACRVMPGGPHRFALAPALGSSLGSTAGVVRAGDHEADRDLEGRAARLRQP